jgi:hypothetical protein
LFHLPGHFSLHLVLGHLHFFCQSQCILTLSREIRVLIILTHYLDSQEQNYGQTWISLPISIATEPAIIIISHTHLLVVNHNSDCFLLQFIHTPAISDLSDQKRWGGNTFF